MKSRPYKFAYYSILMWLFFTSCGQSSKETIQGGWIKATNTELYPLWELKFDHDSVDVVFGAHKVRGWYDLFGDSLKMVLPNGSSLTTPIVFDSNYMIIFDTITFYRAHSEQENDIDHYRRFQFTGTDNWEKEELSPKTAYFDIFLNHSNSDIPVIRIDDTKTELTDLAKSVPNKIEQTRVAPLLFIGKDLNVSELHKVYRELIWSHGFRLFLVTDVRLDSGYCIQSDFLHYWMNDIQLDNDHDSVAPPHPPVFYMDNWDLYAGKPTDTLRLDEVENYSLMHTRRYLIRVPGSMSVRDYIRLSKYVRKYTLRDFGTVRFELDN